MNANHELALYYRPTCPFCIKVLDFIDRKSVTIPLIDISQDRDAAATLIEVGGKQQVPCLDRRASLPIAQIRYADADSHRRALPSDGMIPQLIYAR